MCGSMVDIQSPTAEIRQGKKEEEETTRQKCPHLLHRAATKVIISPKRYKIETTDEQREIIVTYRMVPVPITLIDLERHFNNLISYTFKDAAIRCVFTIIFA